VLLLRNADVFSPRALGLQSLLIGGGTVLWMGPGRDLPALPAALAAGVTEIDLAGLRLIPGLIDGHVPLATLTGSVRGDLALLEPLLGIGELAIGDHRSSQPTFDEILRLAADAHVSGLMTGKAGVLHLHLGDGPRGLDLVRRALSESEIPARVFNPTHVNPRKALFDEAVTLAGKGCYIDLTAFPVEDGEDAWSAAEGLQRYLASGAPADRVTISSDAGGCLPCFDAEGRVSSMDVDHSGALLETLRVLAGADADPVALDATGGAHTVIIRGEIHVREGQAVRRGTFENRQEQHVAEHRP
jgi:beta-aspartyl-dipeptidase (metallo-type)